MNNTKDATSTMKNDGIFDSSLGCVVGVDAKETTLANSDILYDPFG
jgi:hypothetical protein